MVSFSLSGFKISGRPGAYAARPGRGLPVGVLRFLRRLSCSYYLPERKNYPKYGVEIFRSFFQTSDCVPEDCAALYCAALYCAALDFTAEGS